MPKPKTIVTLLIFPKPPDATQLDNITLAGTNKYFVSSPWELDQRSVNEAIRVAEGWLAGVLGIHIEWHSVKEINSPRSLSEWRERNISLIKEETDRLGLPWTDDYVYLAFVRGIGGYAGGVRYEHGNAGYAMVGDVCLEAICERRAPTSGSVLLGDSGWPSNSYSAVGQTGAFIHEVLHGLDLPHPDGWPEGDRPDWDETLMGHWWNMPSFGNTNGLTPREITRVRRWLSLHG